MVIYSFLFRISIHFGGLRVFSFNKKKNRKKNRFLVLIVLLIVLPTGYLHFFIKAISENQKVITDLWLFAHRNDFSKKTIVQKRCIITLAQYTVN
jgi:hypothetical protein